MLGMGLVGPGSVVVRIYNNVGRGFLVDAVDTVIIGNGTHIYDAGETHRVSAVEHRERMLIEIAIAIGTA